MIDVKRHETITETEVFPFRMPSLTNHECFWEPCHQDCVYTQPCWVRHNVCLYVSWFFLNELSHNTFNDPVEKLTSSQFFWCWAPSASVRLVISDWCKYCTRTSVRVKLFFEVYVRREQICWLEGLMFSLCLQSETGRCLLVASSRLCYAAVFSRSVEVLLALAIFTRAQNEPPNEWNEINEKKEKSSGILWDWSVQAAVDGHRVTEKALLKCLWLCVFES